MEWPPPNHAIKRHHNIQIQLMHNGKKLFGHANCLKPYLLLDQTTINPVPNQALEIQAPTQEPPDEKEIVTRTLRSDPPELDPI